MLHAIRNVDDDVDWKDVEDTIRKLTISLVGAAALAAGILLVRQQKQIDPKDSASAIPPVKTVQVQVSLERLRELGI